MPVTVNGAIGADPNMTNEYNSSNTRTSYGASSRLKQFQEEEKQIRKLREDTYKQDRLNEQKLFQYRLANEMKLIKLRQGQDSESYKAAQKLYDFELKSLLNLSKQKKKSEKETQEASDKMMEELEKKTVSIASGFSSMINKAVGILNKAYGSFSLSGATDNVANQISEFRKEFAKYTVQGMDLNTMKDQFTKAARELEAQYGITVSTADLMNTARTNFASTSSVYNAYARGDLKDMVKAQYIAGATNNAAADTDLANRLIREGKWNEYIQLMNVGSSVQRTGNYSYNTISNILNSEMGLGGYATGGMAGYAAAVQNAANFGQLTNNPNALNYYMNESTRLAALKSGDMDAISVALSSGLFGTGGGGAQAANISNQFIGDIASVGGYNAGILGAIPGVNARGALLASNYQNNFGQISTSLTGSADAFLTAQNKQYTVSEKLQIDVENAMTELLPITSDTAEGLALIAGGVNQIIELLSVNSAVSGVGGLINAGVSAALGSGKASTFLGGLGGLVGKAVPWIGAGLAAFEGIKFVLKDIADVQTRSKDTLDSLVAQGYGTTSGKTGAYSPDGSSVKVVSAYEEEARKMQISESTKNKVSKVGELNIQNQISALQNGGTSAETYQKLASQLMGEAGYLLNQRIVSNQKQNALNAAGNATGIYNVATDGYLAKLHKGEMVLPGPQANYIRAMFGLETEPISGVYSEAGYRSNVRGIPEFASGAENVGSVSGDTNVHTWFLDRLSKLATSYGKNLNITSGYRSTEYQGRLFANALKKYGSEKAARKWVAKPGGSRHETGLAADIDGTSGSGSNSWFRSSAGNDILSKFGLWKPLSNENWHVEAIETGYPSLKIRNGSGYSVAELQAKYGLPGSPSLNTGMYSAGVGGIDEGGTTSAIGTDASDDSMFSYLREYSDDPSVANLLAMYDKSSVSSGGTSTVSAIQDNSAYESNKYKSILEKYGTQYGINPRLLYGMMMVESSGNPNANRNNNRQYKGLMQINQSKVDSYVGAGANIYDPDVNINAGAQYLAYTIGKTGSTALGIAGYNTGPGLKVYKAAKQKLDAGGGWNSISNLLSNHEYVEKTYGYAGIPMTPSYLAEGGIVTQPTLSVIGEGKNDEAVIPLDESGSRLSDTLGLTDFQDVFNRTMQFQLDTLVRKIDQVISTMVTLESSSQLNTSGSGSAMSARDNSLVNFSYR